MDADTDVTRRAFLTRASSVTVAGLAGIAGRASRAESSTGAAFDIRNATGDAFAPHIGCTFHATGAGGNTVGLRLVGVRELWPTGGPGARRTPFALAFRGAAGDPLPQNTYQLRHAALGRFPLFLVPGPPGPGGAVYAATFT